MLMLDGSKRLTRDDLARIETPTATRSHRPVPHADVANAIFEIAAKRGYEPVDECWTVKDGTLYPEPGQKVEVPGARMFGTVDMKPSGALLARIGLKAWPDSLTPSIGVRNSHDKSFALSVLCGARVVVCANGMLVGEHHLARKHTSQIDLFMQTELAMDAFERCTLAVQKQVWQLEERKLHDATAHHLVVNAARTGAFSSSQILDVVQEYHEPSHDAFKERNRWSLYNACTEVMKKQSPARQSDGFRRLNQVMLPAPAAA